MVRWGEPAVRSAHGGDEQRDPALRTGWSGPSGPCPAEGNAAQDPGAAGLREPCRQPVPRFSWLLPAFVARGARGRFGDSGSSGWFIKLIKQR